jgi:hypothetical protein
MNDNRKQDGADNGVGSTGGSASEMLICQLVKLAHREHYNCEEDTWYGCPMSRDGCANDAIPKICNCGADAHNAEVDAIAAQLLPNDRHEPRET